MDETQNRVTYVPMAVSDITDAGYMVLVNGKNPIPEVPTISSMVRADFAVQDSNLYAHELALNAARDMLATAKQHGVGDFVIVAGFRTHEQQAFLYERNPKTGGTARPGHSEHHTGLALDIFSRTVNSGSPEQLGNAEPYQWLAKNAHYFGFILRYPQGRSDVTGVPYEPWHFRFVGHVHAFLMKEYNLLHEEYIALLMEKGQITFKMHGTTYCVYHSQPEDGLIIVPQGAEYTLSRTNLGGYIVAVALTPVTDRVLS